MTKKEILADFYQIPYDKLVKACVGFTGGSDNSSIFYFDIFKTNDLKEQLKMAHQSFTVWESEFSPLNEENVTQVVEPEQRIVEAVIAGAFEPLPAVYHLLQVCDSMAEKRMRVTKNRHYVDYPLRFAMRVCSTILLKNPGNKEMYELVNENIKKHENDRQYVELFNKQLLTKIGMDKENDITDVYYDDEDYGPK